MIDPPLLNETLRVEDNNDGTYKALWLTTHTGKFRLWIAGPCGPIKDSFRTMSSACPPRSR